METSFIHPSSLADRQTPSPRQNPRSRRRGAEVSDTRSPSELLKEIGIAGAEVVKVLKGRGWEVCEPKGLEEHKRYYLPGGKAKGEEARRGTDFVVGEGELYAYVLEKGGTRYLIPNAAQQVRAEARRSSSREKPGPRGNDTVSGVTRGKATPKRPVVFESGEGTDLIEYFSDEGLSNTTSCHHQKKRCKKQATPAQVGSSNQQDNGNVIVVDDNNETGSVNSHDLPTRTKQISSELRTPVEQYESALKTRGSHAQFLKDLDLNLLRSVADIAFCQAALDSPNRRNGSTLQDEILHELERSVRRVDVAIKRLSLSVAAIVQLNEGSSSADSGFDIPSFVSTGQGHLVLMQDIERYILLVAQAVRHFINSEPANSSRSSRQISAGADLLPLQQHIATTAEELLELSRRICSQAKK